MASGMLPVDKCGNVPHIRCGKNPGSGHGMNERIIEKQPNAEDLRRALLDRAAQYAKLTDLKLGTVSDRCAGDGKFLSDVAAGGNFTVDRFTKAMAWLDANWPDAPASEAATLSSTKENGAEEKEAV